MVFVKKVPHYNPTWPEVIQKCAMGRKGRDRIDVVTRVFKLKLKELLVDVVNKGMLGKVAAWMYTVEWQKRGLPHAHILLIFTPEFKLRGPADYDAVISAELPEGNII